QLDHEALGDVEEAKLLGGTKAVLEAAANDRQAPAGSRGEADDVLDAVDVGGEGRHDDPVRRAGEDLLEGRVEVALGAAGAGALGVRRVAQEQVDPLVPEASETLEVGGPAVRGLDVDLEVAGVDDLA